MQHVTVTGIFFFLIARLTDNRLVRTLWHVPLVGSAVSSRCLIRSRLIPIDIHSKNFLLQNKALQNREALEIRMSFLVLEKMAEIFAHCEEEKAST